MSAILEEPSGARIGVPTLTPGARESNRRVAGGQAGLKEAPTGIEPV